MADFYKLKKDIGEVSIITGTEANAYQYHNDLLEPATKEDVEIMMRKKWLDLTRAITYLFAAENDIEAESFYEKAVVNLVSLLRYKEISLGVYE